MSMQLYPTAKAALVQAGINWLVGTQNAALVSGYTYSAAHQFFTDIAIGGGTVASTQALSGKTAALGVCIAANSDFGVVATGPSVPAVIIYQATNAAGGAVATSAQQLIAYDDGIALVPCALAALSGATSIAVDPLVAALAIGSSVTFAGVVATLTAGAAIGARALAVSATSGAIAQGVVGVSSAQGGFPFTPNAVNDVQIHWDAANGIFKLL